MPIENVLLPLTPELKEVAARIAFLLLEEGYSPIQVLAILSLAVWQVSVTTSNPPSVMQAAQSILSQLEAGCPICGRHESHAHGPEGVN